MSTRPGAERRGPTQDFAGTTLDSLGMMKTGNELLEEARQRVSEIGVDELRAEQSSGGSPVLLDVRDQPEVNLGRIPGALHVSRGNLETKVEALVPREARVVVYCANGNRSVLAADTLAQMGYGNVASLAGGFRGWAESGGDIED
jgi:rhodanese-related sulfurtransferase